MQLSTSTNFFGYRLDGGYTSYKESLNRCKAAGFRVLDVNFCAALNGLSDLSKDHWRELIEDLRNEAEKEGIIFTQSHPVFTRRVDALPEEKQEVYHEMMRRSIIASSILGVKWAILHPAPGRDGEEFDLDACVKENLELHAPALELAKKHNVGIAFENMIEKSTRRFASRAADLVALIDACNDSGIGACWDFGHGNFIFKDQRDELRILGKRLKATHVNDNNGHEDGHMFPFHGTVNWQELLPVLAEIGYEGDFTFETHKEFTRLPDPLKDLVAQSGYAIGRYCLSLIS
ncbi:sugar phosphate isomerase/epimerase family protein [Paenibacillus cremeus]|nr:sugar phosphate isomerase/epimerase family protein [Paenibacillus cremeus]